MIGYRTPDAGRVTLRVFDILGREVATLIDALQEGGNHSASFSGAALASGMYVYRLTTPSGSLARTMMLVR